MAQPTAIDLCQDGNARYDFDPTDQRTFITGCSLLLPGDEELEVAIKLTKPQVWWRY